MSIQISHPLFRNSPDVKRAVEKLNALLNLEVVVESAGVISSRSFISTAGESSTLAVSIPEVAGPDLSAYALNAPQLLAWASTMTINLSSNPRAAMFVQGGATTLAFIGIATGNCMTLLIKGSGNALSFPAGVTVTHTTTTDFPQASRLARVDIACFGSAAANVFIRTYYS